MSHIRAKFLFLSIIVTFAQLAIAQTVVARFGVEPELRVGARMSSANGKYVLIVQSDGNAVVYRVDCIGDPACSTFDTGTRKRTITPIFRHQGDGNLVLYDGSSMKALWTAGAKRYAEYRLSVSDAGDLTQQQITYRARWSYKTGRPKRPANLNCSPRERSICETLNSAHSHIRSVPGAEKQLVTGERLTSPDGNFTLVVQGDGNAVVYLSACVGDPSCSVFPTGTSGKTSAPVLRMQSDGNLVLYDASDPTHLKDIFNIGVTGNGEYLLVLQNDGNLVVYQAVVLGERTIKRPVPVSPDKPPPLQPEPTQVVPIAWDTCITTTVTALAPNKITSYNRCEFAVRAEFVDACNGTPMFGSTFTNIPPRMTSEISSNRSDCSPLGGNTFERKIIRAWRLL